MTLQLKILSALSDFIFPGKENFKVFHSSCIGSQINALVNINSLLMTQDKFNYIVFHFHESSTCIIYMLGFVKVSKQEELFPGRVSYRVLSVQPSDAWDAS